MSAPLDQSESPSLETMRIYDLLDLKRMARASGDDALVKQIDAVLDSRGYFRRRVSFGTRGTAC